METDYRVAQFDLGVSGSYTGSNKVFGSLISLQPVDGRAISGKIHNVSVMFSGSTFKGNIDLVFHSTASTVGTVQSDYKPTFNDMKQFISCVSLIGTSSLGSDYSTVGDHSVASVHNLNIPFDSDSVYMSSIYQNTTNAVFPSGSVWAIVGYELGQSN